MSITKRSNSEDFLTCSRCRGSFDPPEETTKHGISNHPDGLSGKDSGAKPSLIRRVLSRKIVPSSAKSLPRVDSSGVISLPKSSDSGDRYDSLLRSDAEIPSDNRGSNTSILYSKIPTKYALSANSSPVESVAVTVSNSDPIYSLLQNEKNLHDNFTDDSVSVSGDSIIKLFFHTAHKCEKCKDSCPGALLLAAPISYLKNNPSPLWGLLYYSELVVYSGRPGFLETLKAGVFCSYFNNCSGIDSSLSSSLKSKTDIILRIPTKRCIAIKCRPLCFEAVFSGGSMNFYLKNDSEVLTWISVINSVSARTNLSLCRSGFSRPIDFKYNNLIRLLTRKLACLTKFSDKKGDACAADGRKLEYAHARADAPRRNLSCSNKSYYIDLAVSNSVPDKRPGSRPLPPSSGPATCVRTKFLDSRDSSRRIDMNNPRCKFIKDIISIILNSPGRNWYELNAVLFVSHRTFTTLDDLIDILNLSFIEDNSDLNAKLMIVWMIYFWFEGFRKDDFGCASACTELSKLISNLKSHCISLDSPICSSRISDHVHIPNNLSTYSLELKDLSIPLRILELIVSHRVMESKWTPAATREMIYPPPIQYHRLFDESSDFLTLDVQKLAECLTINEYILISSTNPISFLAHACKSNGSNETQSLLDSSSGLRPLTENFNIVSYWVATEVCFFADIRIRVQTVEKCIQLACELYKLRNYNSLMAVVSGLNSSSVRRLKMTWSRVRNKFLYKLYKLERLLHPKLNFSLYRSILRLREYPIPAISYIQDALEGKVARLSADSIDENQNIESTNSKNLRLKPLFCCIPGYSRKSELFTSDLELKGKFFFAKSMGGYPISPATIRKRKAIVPIFFLFIKDLLFTIVGGSNCDSPNSSYTRYIEHIEVVRLLANFAQIPAGAAPKRLVDTYNNIKSYVGSCSPKPYSSANSIGSAAPRSPAYPEYAFCKDLFWLKESCLLKISHLHENNNL